MIGVSVEQFFTGSSDTSLLHDLEGAALTRYKRQVDTTYSDFVKRVADGRKMTLDEVENVAGGRIMNGKEALKGNQSGHVIIAPLRGIAISYLTDFIDL